MTTNDWGAFPGKPKGEYYVIKSLTGEPGFQTVSVALEEFTSSDSKVSVPLKNWQTVTELSFSPSITVLKDGRKTPMESKPWRQPENTRIRNLRWEGGQYQSVRTSSATLTEEEHRKNFNEAIKKSLQQEALEKK